MIAKKQATLDRFDGRQAVLVLENGQEVSLSKEELGTAAIGELFSVRIMPESEAVLHEAALARALLNQLLHEDGQGTSGS